MKLAFFIVLAVLVVRDVIAGGDYEKRKGKKGKGKKGKGKKGRKGKGKKGKKEKKSKGKLPHMQLGPRPYYLVESMKPSWLKEELARCAAETETFYTSDFSIGHRGACLQFPEHTLRSYVAASIMGAGINECDVTFTKDRELICRHAQCDLHTTTDVVLRPEMNAKCTTPWTPGGRPRCCATDFTLAEIKTLCAKMDSSGGSSAMTAEEYVYGGTADWRTDLYQYECPQVPTHAESIALIQAYGGKFTPELKAPAVDMPYEGDYTQEDYAQQMIDEYIAAGVPPEDVWPQSFMETDVFYWVSNTDYGDQAVALDGVEDKTPMEIDAYLDSLVAGGARIVAPPMWFLVEESTDPSNELGIQLSYYSKAALARDLDIITWTLERTQPGLDGWYWTTLQGLDLVDGDKYALLYVLAFEAGILGMFSDWPATTTFFANCMGLAVRSQ